MTPASPSNGNGRDPRVLAIDAGGTMTDTFIVDSSGDFVVGKAQTTPADEALGFMASTRDALGYWGLEAEQALPGMVSGIYSGTAMLNRLLERKGRRVGLIVTAGMEDGLRIERGIQTYLGYPYSDRLHVATHYHNEPLVPRELIRGVRERVDLFGEPAIPLYEDEARQAVEELVAEGVEGIVVNLLYSYRNSSHEDRIRDIAAELAPAVTAAVPLERAVPDAARLPAPQLHADRGLRRGAVARAAPARARRHAARPAPSSTCASWPRTAARSRSTPASWPARSISGPIGGVIGARYLVDAVAEGSARATSSAPTSAARASTSP